MPPNRIEVEADAAGSWTTRPRHRSRRREEAEEVLGDEYAPLQPKRKSLASVSACAMPANGVPVTDRKSGPRHLFAHSAAGLGHMHQDCRGHSGDGTRSSQRYAKDDESWILDELSAHRKHLSTELGVRSPAGRPSDGAHA